jgi:hypothetical protein
LKKYNLFSTLAIASVFLFASCQKDDYVEVVGLCPTVVSTNPINGATGITLNSIIKATFNEKMNPATITTSTFTLQDTSGVAVSGIVAYVDTTASFTPSVALSPNKTYIARIKTSVKSSKGNAIQSEYSWRFTTGINFSPTVIGTDPANNVTGVEPNKVVTATFSVPMNPLTLTPVTFRVTQGTTPVAGTVTYVGSTAYFTPSINLLSNTAYTATITTGAMNVAGTPMGYNYKWNFVLKVI